jgi:hypothetical protein
MLALPSFLTSGIGLLTFPAFPPGYDPIPEVAVMEQHDLAMTQVQLREVVFRDFIRSFLLHLTKQA